MRVYLFGFASDDFLGRVIVTPDQRTVAQLADQLVAWGLAPEWDASLHGAQRGRRHPRSRRDHPRGWARKW